MRSDSRAWALSPQATHLPLFPDHWQPALPWFLFWCSELRRLTTASRTSHLCQCSSLFAGFPMVTSAYSPYPIYFPHCNQYGISQAITQIGSSPCPLPSTPHTQSFLPKFNSFPLLCERKKLTEMNKDLCVQFLPTLCSLNCLPCSWSSDALCFLVSQSWPMMFPWPGMFPLPFLILVTSHISAQVSFLWGIFLHWQD